MNTKTPLLTLLMLSACLSACSDSNVPATTDDPVTGDDGDDSAGDSDDDAPAPAAEPAPEPMSTPEPAPAAGSCDTTNFTPKCDLAPTAAGEEIKKGTACTAADPQCCFRSCGPQSIGWKTETCLAEVYAEGDCQFPPDADYSCYSTDNGVDATVCPQDVTPRAGEECTVPECTLCNLDDTYLDSGGASKVGYCVCQEPNTDGLRTWSCGSSTAWPCPLGQGC